MSRRGPVDPTPHLAAVAAAMAKPGQPAATYAALETATKAVLGHTLFTILKLHAPRLCLGAESARALG